MEYEEKEINESELTLLNILNGLECLYADSIPKHIKEMMIDLIKALINDVDIDSNDSRDYVDVKLIRRAYFEE